MFQASSLLVNTELASIPGEVVRSFFQTATVIGVTAFIVVTLMAIYGGSTMSQSTALMSLRSNFKIGSFFGFVVALFFFAATFFAQAAIFTDNLSLQWGLIYGVVHTFVVYVAFGVIIVVIYLIPRVAHTISEFFHHRPPRLG